MPSLFSFAFNAFIASYLRAIQCSPPHQTANASTASVQTIVISCHVQFALQPYIQLQVIYVFISASVNNVISPSMSIPLNQIKIYFSLVLKLVKKESPAQHDAFEIYFRLGSSRSLAKLHSVLSQSSPLGKKVVSLRTLKEWSRVYDWVQRCIIRDAEVARKVEQRSTADVVSVKAKFLQQVQSVIATAFDSNTGAPLIVCDQARDLKNLIDAALKLLGEPEREAIELSFNVKKYDEEVEDETQS